MKENKEKCEEIARIFINQARHSQKVLQIHMYINKYTGIATYSGSLKSAKLGVFF